MKIEKRHRAISLREQGNSLKDIAERLNVAKSSVSLWVRDIELSPVARERLLTRIKLGQFISAEKKRAQTREREDQYLLKAQEDIKKLSFDTNLNQLICALLYWCEGVKSPSAGLCFINSDPEVIRKFLYLLRSSFPVDESKFRSCIHLHSYHSPRQQLDFWSKVTDIDKQQFIKPYIKPNSRKRIRPHYQGCISIRYHSNDLARRLLAIAKGFLKMGV